MKANPKPGLATLAVGAVASLIIAILLGLVCRGDHDIYTDSFKESFVASCVEQGAPKPFCRCGMEWLEDNVPISDFQAADPNGSQMAEWLEMAGEACETSLMR